MLSNKYGVKPYQHFVENLDLAINSFGVILNDYFGTFYKVSSRTEERGHKTAHCYWTTKAGETPVYARVTNSGKWQSVGYDTFAHEDIMDICVKIDMNGERRRILSTVDYLILVYPTTPNTKLTDGTSLALINSRKLISTMDIFMEGGNNALSEHGIAVIGGGFAYIPLGQLVKWNCLDKLSFSYTPGIASYRVGSETRNLKVPKAQEWLKKLQSVSLPMHTNNEARPVTLVNKKGVIGAYDSISKAAFAIWGDDAFLLEGKNGRKVVDEKALVNCVMKISQVLSGNAKKTKGPEGEWFTVYDSDTWIKMTDSEKRESLLVRLLTKKELAKKLGDAA